MEERKDIVIYQSEDGLVKMEAMVDASNETIWATQKAIAKLFATTPQNITTHIGNIYQVGELKTDTTCKDFLQVQNEGGRTVKRKLSYYNLDMIISIGYRVNSVRATKFRIWATGIIKQYMLKGYAVNRSIV